MFVQVIRGEVADAQALRSRLDDWKGKLAAGAQGWLGTTAGVTDDGQFVALACFESEEAARRNSDRPEQGAWWSEVEPLIHNATFADATEVHSAMNGMDPSAKFVQVIEARLADADRARTLMSQTDALSQARPDILGMIAVVHGDRSTQAVYFRDEASAREGESREPSDDDRAMMEEFDATFADPSYLDLRDPWFHQP